MWVPSAWGTWVKLLNLAVFRTVPFRISVKIHSIIGVASLAWLAPIPYLKEIRKRSILEQKQSKAEDLLQILRICNFSRAELNTQSWQYLSRNPDPMNWSRVLLSDVEAPHPIFCGCQTAILKFGSTSNHWYHISSHLSMIFHCHCSLSPHIPHSSGPFPHHHHVLIRCQPFPALRDTPWHQDSVEEGSGASSLELETSTATSKNTFQGFFSATLTGSAWWYNSGLPEDWTTPSVWTLLKRHTHTVILLAVYCVCGLSEVLL